MAGSPTQEGIEIRLELPNARQILEAFEKAPEIVVEELGAATWEGSLLIQREVVERTPRGVGAGGGLAGSIQARDPQIAPGLVRGEVGTALSYAVPVELGTRPHFPPIEPLQLWAQHKLGLSEVEAESAAYAIARKIKAHGSQGVHMFAEGFAATEEQLRTFYARAGERAVERIGQAGGGQ
ncbi:MAG: hypothetical protein WD100_02980 [Tistlia sp.]|uniref:hypothetical protein n=1 Tax=Tistlia sp. TaxID=3057121 RepID=UPI0034A1F372